MRALPVLFLGVVLCVVACVGAGGQVLVAWWWWVRPVRRCGVRVVLRALGVGGVLYHLPLLPPLPWAWCPPFPLPFPFP